MVVSKINVLNAEVVGKISAGEVVERPASAVKELVENSIDAGADSIAIEVESAGAVLIRVADNGEGMTDIDAELAAKQHATSKIKDIADLESLNTFGFRGEALASIAAVSQMEIISRREESETGVHVFLESAEVLKTRPAARPTGTTIEVRNLFYNVPARRKFLKRDSTELAEMVDTIGRFVVSYPNIEFKLTHGGRVLVHATHDMKLFDRIRHVLGAQNTEHMIEFSHSAGGYSVTGYVSRPSATRKDRTCQMFFVNGRFVRSKTLSDAVYDAYRSMLERGRHPAAVIFLELPPSEIDVNVHPTKLVVKFENEKSIKEMVAEAIKSRFSDVKNIESLRPLAPFLKPIVVGGDVVPYSGVETQNEFLYSSVAEKTLVACYQEKIFSGEENIFQIGKCYIVQQRPDGLVVTDQHAAHERILYEFFTKAVREGLAEVQNLLFPVRLDLSAGEAVIIERITASLAVLGFRVEPFGERSYVIQTVPARLRDRDIKGAIMDVLSELSITQAARAETVDELIKLTSCRSAIKAGEILTRLEMSALLEDLAKCESPFTCPHGRPTVLNITIDELEKRFRRK